MKKKILIDVDEVICDSGFLNMLNEYLNTNYTIDFFKTYYIEEDVMSDENQKLDFYQFISKKNPYEYATIYKGAKETIEKLNEVYDVYICSSCAMNCLKKESGLYFKNKYEFIVENFPYIDINKIILTGSKNIFSADIQIDDKFSHLQSDIPLKLLFTSYHNKNLSKEELQEKNVRRVNNWDEIAKILL